jgi:hypothetical protein
MLYALLTAAALNAPGPGADENPAPPKGPQPTARVASLDEEGNVRVRITEAGERPVTTVKRTVVGGAVREVETTVMTPFFSEIVKKVPVKDVKAFDTRGKALDEKALAEALKKETIVLVSADGNPVDPFYLKIVKEGTVVLVLPQDAKEKTPGPLLPPLPTLPPPKGKED